MRSYRSSRCSFAPHDRLLASDNQRRKPGFTWIYQQCYLTEPNQQTDPRLLSMAGTRVLIFDDSRSGRPARRAMARRSACYLLVFSDLSPLSKLPITVFCNAFTTRVRSATKNKSVRARERLQPVYHKYLTLPDVS